MSRIEKPIKVTKLCGNCEFMATIDWKHKCRRHAPTTKLVIRMSGACLGTDDEMGQFPSVRETDWCGDWKREVKRT